MVYHLTVRNTADLLSWMEISRQNICMYLIQMMKFGSWTDWGIWWARIDTKVTSRSLGIPQTDQPATIIGPSLKLMQIDISLKPLGSVGWLVRGMDVSFLMRWSIFRKERGKTYALLM